MPRSTVISNHTYCAFISYKHTDEKIAKWLKMMLEQYRLPTKLCKQYAHVPKRLTEIGDIYLDNDTLRPGLMDKNLEIDMAATKYLIVVCSRSAHDAPRYINQEIETFLRAGHTPDQIIPFIVDDSQTPEQDCFPSALQKINETRDLIGVNIYDKGRMQAFLKVVAYMLGIQVVELVSANDRRKRKKVVIATLVTVFSVILSLFLWFYAVPQKQYYVDYTEVYGIPQGIGKLSKEDTEQMDAHYTIIKQFGQVVELRYENFAGKIIDHDNSEYMDRPSRAIYDGTRDGEHLYVIFQDSRGRVLVEYSYSQDRTSVDIKNSTGYAAPLLASTTGMDGSIYTDLDSFLFGHGSIINYAIDYDDYGHISEKRYVKDSFASPTCDASNIWGFRYVRDELGRAIQVDYLKYVGDQAKPGGANHSDDYVLMEDSYRVCKKRYKYENYDLVSIQFLNSKDELVLNEKTWAECRITYDSHHNIQRITYYDTHTRPTCCSDGYHELSITRNGVRHRTYLCGGNGLIITSNEGYAFLEQKFNKKGELILQRTSDCFGNPVIPDDCFFSAVEYTYKKNGRYIKATYVDDDGNVTVDENGVAGYIVEYDKHGNQLLLKFIDMNKDLTENGDGCAIQKCEYDSVGRLTKLSFLDSNNELISVNELGDAGAVIRYDAIGNLESYSLIGCDGKEFLRIKSQYDSFGNEIIREYFDENDNPSDDGYGVFRFVSEYNEYGDHLGDSFWDKDGNAVLWEYIGAAKCTITLDDYGNEIRMSCYDTDGEHLILSSLGYAECVTTYTSKGHVLRREFYGADGNPVLIEDGDIMYSAYENLYDEYGIFQKVLFFDANGNRIEPDD